MALLLQNGMVQNFFETEVEVVDGAITDVKVDGKLHAQIIQYPAQEKCPKGATVALCRKPFIDFAMGCGGAGAMTADMIAATYGDQIPANMATALEDDFASGYGNYKEVPPGMTLVITAPPIPSIFTLCKEPEQPEPNPEEKA